MRRLLPNLASAIDARACASLNRRGYAVVDGFLGETRNRVYGALVGMGVLKTLCIVVAAIYLDKSGRRPMLLGSVFGCVEINQ